MISIVLPVYNEEKRLKQGLEKILSFLASQKHPFEVIVVNDGSADRTSQILAGFLGQPHLRIINHQKNCGKGAAVKTGVMAARGELILFSDIDLSVPIEALAQFIKKTQEGFDVVIGSRRVKDAKILVHQPFWRELMGQTFTKLSNFVLGTNFADFTCGFKMLKRQAAQKIFERQRLNDWAFDSEILFLAKKMGLRVAEVGVTWSDVSDSKVRFPHDIFLSLLGLLKIRWYDLKK